MSEIVLIGATGTVGREVVKALVARNAEVRAAVRDPARASLAIPMVRADLDDADSLERAFAGARRLFLLTAHSEQVVAQVERAVAAAEKASLELIVRLSAAGASKKASLATSRDHAEAEERIAGSGIPWAALRPNFFMIDPTRGSFGASRGAPTSYVSPRDIGECAAEILLRPEPHYGKKYPLTGREAYTDDEAARIASELAGRPIRHVELSPEALRAHLVARGMSPAMVEDTIELEEIKASGQAKGITDCVAKILGRAPETFREFLAGQ